MFTIIFIASFITLYVIVWGIIVGVSMSKKRIHNCDYKAIEKKRTAWLLGSLFWTMLDYLFPILSLICSFAVVFSEQGKSQSIQLLTVTATICAMLSFIINPKKHARTYRISFTIIDHVMDLFNAELISVYELIDMVNTCENIISQSYDSTLEKDIVDKLNNIAMNSKNNVNSKENKVNEG